VGRLSGMLLLKSSKFHLIFVAIKLWFIPHECKPQVFFQVCLLLFFSLQPSQFASVLAIAWGAQVWISKRP
jgi:hypothetical protein